MSPARQLAALLLAFGLIAGSVLFVHLWLPAPQPLALVFEHAGTVGFAYTIWLVVLAGALHGLHRVGQLERVRVWHVWAVSFACYGLGYFVDSFRDELVVALHPDVEHGGSYHHFVRLVPVWLLVTFLFVQPYVHRTLLLEIERLGALNEALAAEAPAAATRGADPTVPAPADRRVVLGAGRTRLDLPADAIHRISVDDHYCYVHYAVDGRRRKADVGLPLRELLPLLPPADFVQIHRSHVVNVHAVVRISRIGRTCRVHLRDEDAGLPISRQRLHEVLPRLERRSAIHRNGAAQHV